MESPEQALNQKLTLRINGLTADGDHVSADLYVEDSPENVESLRGKGFHTICFGNSTNTTVAGPRVKSWKEAYELIHEHFSSSNGLLHTAAVA